MANITITLENGLKVGDVVHNVAVLREATVGDILAGSEESEKLMPTPDGYQLVPSPAHVSLNILRRQIVSIGELEAPFELSQMMLLSAKDLDLLHRAADSMDTVIVKELEERGRNTAPSG